MIDTQANCFGGQIETPTVCNLVQSASAANLASPRTIEARFIAMSTPLVPQDEGSQALMPGWAISQEELHERPADAHVSAR